METPGIPVAITLDTPKDGVMVVGFRVTRVIEEGYIKTLGHELSCVGMRQPARLIVNFSAVEFFSSAALGSLITLGSHLHERLILCGMVPVVYRVFTITKLHRCLRIVHDLDEALSLK